MGFGVQRGCEAVLSDISLAYRLHGRALKLQFNMRAILQQTTAVHHLLFWAARYEHRFLIGFTDTMVPILASGHLSVTATLQSFIVSSQDVWHTHPHPHVVSCKWAKILLFELQRCWWVGFLFCLSSSSFLLHRAVSILSSNEDIS